MQPLPGCWCLIFATQRRSLVEIVMGPSRGVTSSGEVYQGQRGLLVSSNRTGGSKLPTLSSEVKLRVRTLGNKIYQLGFGLGSFQRPRRFGISNFCSRRLGAKVACLSNKEERQRNGARDTGSQTDRMTVCRALPQERG